MLSDRSCNDAVMKPLDIDFVRAQFPAFSASKFSSDAFFENAGGSYACGATIDALCDYYVNTKVQPYHLYESATHAGSQMDHSRRRWAQALGVQTDEVLFGPSTSINTYVIAQAFGQILKPGDEVIVTNQDHEANSGSMRRFAERAGATVRLWQINPDTALLELDALEELLNENTKVVCFPHCSNIVGVENDVKAIVAAAHRVGARTVVDGVSFAPHGFSNVADLGADIYLFSLYKTFSVHQGLIVARNGVLDVLPHQGHWFNAAFAAKHLTPAGPDHAQEAAAGAVLDYVEASAKHHGLQVAGLADAVAQSAKQWQAREDSQVAHVANALRDKAAISVIGPLEHPGGGHRCPTIAFVVKNKTSTEAARELIGKGIQCGCGHFYAKNLLDAVRVEGQPIDSDEGVVRLSWVHYTSDTDIDRLVEAISSTNW